MKRILIILSILICFTAYAQSDVTVFLGKPVDGTKAEMREHLIKKGFTPKTVDNNEFFEGEFNGIDVNIYIATTKNKVSRIYVAYKDSFSESQIKIHYNNLVKQFENSNKYVTLSDNSIPEDEDISYEMVVHKKQYQAIFYQLPDESKTDTLKVRQLLSEIIDKEYPEYDHLLDGPKKQQMQNEISMKITMALIEKKIVWFTISEFAGKYFIGMFYDNMYNRKITEDI